MRVILLAGAVIGGIALVVFLVMVAGLLPPQTIAMVGVFMWMSGAEDDWKEFKKPILNVLDAVTPFHKALRTFYLIAIPIILWGFSYNSFLPNLDEPIELRTVHPAPPASTKVHGKTFVLQTASNPYRVNAEGK